MASAAVQRISVRWLPDPASEDTDTIALNVGGYFIDLRVYLADQTIQWSRAGERIKLKDDPPTFRWTHIIDSLDLTVPDEAHFEKLPNGDDLEIGVTPAPHNNNIPTAYEEVWRDVTAKKTSSELSWILQSEDVSAFVGKVGGTYLAIQKTSAGFAARRENKTGAEWSTTFKSQCGEGLLSATQVIGAVEADGQAWTEGQTIRLQSTSYVFRAVSAD